MPRWVQYDKTHRGQQALLTSSRILKPKFSQQEVETLARERNVLMLQRGVLESRMHRWSEKKQRARIGEAVNNYLNNAIAFNKARGKPTAALEKQKKSVAAVVDKIMRLPESTASRKEQKSNLKRATGIYGAGWLVIGPTTVMAVDSLHRGDVTGSKYAAFGGLGGGYFAFLMSIGSAHEYWEKRGGIRAMEKAYTEEIRRINGGLKEAGAGSPYTIPPNRATKQARLRKSKGWADTP